MNDLTQDLASAWDERTDALVERLPAKVGNGVRWLRAPEHKIVRIVSGVLLVIGGCLSILPILGLWMLPLGLALLADDWPALKPRLEGAARWMERQWRRVRPLPDA